MQSTTKYVGTSIGAYHRQPTKQAKELVLEKIEKQFSRLQIIFIND